jgi:hypothetical protein
VLQNKGAWQINDGLRKQLLCISQSKMETWERDFEYHDKMELKKDY